VEIDGGVYGGVYHLTRRADVLAVLRNPGVFSSLARGRGVYSGKL
jgi:hypothetical protein